MEKTEECCECGGTGVGKNDAGKFISEDCEWCEGTGEIENGT